ncbi:MAG: methyltransferase domain-containing protein [Ferruginibacter sp.]
MENKSVGFHGQIAEAFNEKYSKSQDFIERFSVWKSVLDKHIPGSGTTLDLGCGSGIFSYELSRLSKSVIGIDGSSEMLSIAKKGAERNSIKNIDFIQGLIPDFIENNKDLPLFDAIISSSVLEYIPEINSTIKLMHGSLNKNGKMIVSVPNKRSLYRRAEYASFKLFGFPKYLDLVKNRYSVKEFSSLLKSYGFTVIDIKYYSIPGYLRFLKPVAGKDRISNLFLVVAQK